jgi:hypothetical protein
MPRPPYSWGESPRYALNIRLGAQVLFLRPVHITRVVIRKHYNWACAYANEFPIFAEDLEVVVLRSFLQVSMRPCERMGVEGKGVLWLDSFRGLEPTVVCLHELKDFATQGRESLLVKRLN